MATARLRGLRNQLAYSILAGAILGGFLGFAAAQDIGAGFLNSDCAARCAANGYELDFCSQVCWVPDPAAAARDDNLDWKCIGVCGERGGSARECLARCSR